jgi:hypothetical protein
VTSQGNEYVPEYDVTDACYHGNDTLHTNIAAKYIPTPLPPRDARSVTYARKRDVRRYHDNEIIHKNITAQVILRSVTNARNRDVRRDHDNETLHNNMTAQYISLPPDTGKRTQLARNDMGVHNSST